MTFPPSVEDINNWNTDAFDAGGGGGNWWETTATGAVTISPSDAAAIALDVVSANLAADGSDALRVTNGGGDVVLDLATDGTLLLHGRGVSGGGIIFQNPATVFSVGSTGAVTISPSVTVDTALQVGDGVEDYVLLVGNNVGPDSQPGAWVNGTLGASLDAGDVFLISRVGTSRIEANDTGLGFFGATPAAKPTGVAVNAAGIHAALVTLGLIGA